MDFQTELNRKIRKRIEKKANSKLVFWYSKSRRKAFELISKTFNKTDAYLMIKQSSREEIKKMLQ